MDTTDRRSQHTNTVAPSPNPSPGRAAGGGGARFASFPPSPEDESVGLAGTSPLSRFGGGGGAGGGRGAFDPHGRTKTRRRAFLFPCRSGLGSGSQGPTFTAAGKSRGTLPAADAPTRSPHPKGGDALKGTQEQAGVEGFRYPDGELAGPRTKTPPPHTSTYSRARIAHPAWKTRTRPPKRFYF